ncbi:MAG TPA: hypothetical protein PLV68_09355, partial [Ilumatobacteraceae bacterium]|nr:hypothetical protein [Ilumatobacteraceae bacterium]
AVVADPLSPLHGGQQAGASELAVAAPGGIFGTGVRLSAEDEANVDRGVCSIEALAHLRGIFTPRGVEFRVQDGQPNCFGDGRLAFVIVRSVGRGVVVGLGDNRPLTNAYLRYADNAGLVTALVAPQARMQVRIMIGSEARPTAADVGSGDERLADLVEPSVWMALTQLALAFAVLAVARGWRAGASIAEPQRVPIAGSELVTATANVMQRARRGERAAWLLRAELYRNLADRYRCPPDVSIDGLVSAVVAHRPDCDARDLHAVLTWPTSATADDLVQLGNRIEALRVQLLTEPATPTPTREVVP